MFSSTRMTYDVAQARHQQHLDHAARIRQIQQDRSDPKPVDRPARRLITVARLAATSVMHLIR